MKVFALVSLIVLLQVDVIAQVWEPVQSLPAAAPARHHPTTFSIDGKGYLVAGAEANTVALGDCYEYDPNSDSWTQKNDFPGLARGFAYSVSSDTKGYLGFLRSSFCKLATQTNTWVFLKRIRSDIICF